MMLPALSSSGLRNTDPAFAPPGWCSRRHRTISVIRASHASGVSGSTRKVAPATTSFVPIEDVR